MLAFKLIPIAALILILIALAPLASFVYSLKEGEFNARFEMRNGRLVAVLEYNMDVSLEDVTFTIGGVKAGGNTVENSTYVDKLVKGGVVEVSIPLDAYSSIELALEGKIAGIYHIRISVEKSLGG
ncbi:MAG: hypothetical protein F7B95_03705 [Desulfurococcales archaeon]|nr:hypothetical protein [Desulfurococcales archaeon]